MKLGIVIPLKSRRASRNWKVLGVNLEETLHSLERQSSSDWLAVVVGHERPDITWEKYSEKIGWVTSAYELPPIRHGGAYTNCADFDRILDKNRKTGQGMLHLMNKGITYWFVLDADDLIHSEFVHTLGRLPHQPGWLLRSGYLWYRDLRRWMSCDRMLNLCGSSVVISSSLFEVPTTNLDEDLKQIPWCRMSHSDMDGFLLPYLTGFNPAFPFPAIAYTLSHGDNCSDEFRTSFRTRIKLWIKKRLQARPIDREFAEMFGVNDK